MFFRRQHPKHPGFAERLENAKKAGFEAVPLEDSRVMVRRNGCAGILENQIDHPRVVQRAGFLIGSEIAALVDVGYQKFWQTPSGKRKPALAAELKALHEFEEDLREALGMESLYNEALGTVSTYYLYDRLENRDQGVPKRVWER